MADTVITITIPEAWVQPLLDAFATKYGWTEESGYTKAQWAKLHVKLYIKNVVKDVRSGEAATTASEAELLNVETNFLPTVE